MREIVFDTETTGLDPADGHRVIELGCVELFDHLPTGKTFHRYLNPERPVPPESQRVHGLDDAFLADKPHFAAIADEFLEFLGDAPLVIHNAAFDIKFINAELSRAKLAPIPLARAVDTIEIAKAKLPGARYSLDELCKRFGIDLSERNKHGALIDAALTARLYLELIGGRQTRLELAPGGDRPQAEDAEGRMPRARPNVLPPRLRESEKTLHARFVDEELGPAAIWKRI